ncbi:MAG TPA: hypothetical protein VFN09_06100 [Rhodanobacteraceae bacterium]|nr:hypothetical protein [Rhodanobacteraceae bacterium]
MPASRPPLLTRLRRHRGLWLLAVCVLVLKFASGTVCLADGVLAATPDAPVAAWLDAVTGDPAAAQSEPACLLGEGSDCHCTCAHSAPLPITLATLPASPLPLPWLPRLLPGRLPAAQTALLRPPIA